MSRVFDLLLIGAIAFAAWWLLGRGGDAAPAPEPVEVTVAVTGDVPLDGLALIVSASGVAAAGSTPPRQSSDWRADRTARLSVPAPGSYSLRWGTSDAPTFGQPTDHASELDEAARLEDQRVEITGRDGEPVIEITLTAAHADALRAAAAR